MQHIAVCAVRTTGCGLLFALALGSAAAQDAPAPVKRPFELPPSADLHYELQARQRGFGLKGDAIVSWRAGDGKYAVSAESRVPVLGTITDNRSSGAVDAAPSSGRAPGGRFSSQGATMPKPGCSR
jgi:hypothetical protein